MLSLQDRDSAICRPRSRGSWLGDPKRRRSGSPLRTRRTRMAWSSTVPARGTPALVSCLCRFSCFHHAHRIESKSVHCSSTRSRSSSALRGRTTAVNHARTIVLSPHESPLSERGFPTHAPPPVCFAEVFVLHAICSQMCQESEPAVSPNVPRQNKLGRRRRIDSRQMRSCKSVVCTAADVVLSWWAVSSRERTGIRTFIGTGSGQRATIGLELGWVWLVRRLVHSESSEVTESGLSHRAV